MLKKIKDILIIGSILVLGFLSFKSKQREPVLAYIDTDHLLENYQGTKEATEQLTSKTTKWQNHIDSLKKVYMAKTENFYTDSSMLSQEDKKAEKQSLLQMKYTISQMQGNQQKSFKTEDERLSKGILNKIDYELANYCVENNFTLVLGATPGTVLYANDAIDITDQVLDMLNSKYKGE
tara:strand:- start:790 stop:1326 length:537 start_codon:yes stop_codon:yes gene_type:complete